MMEKNLLNEASLEMNVAISQKKLRCMIFDKKNDRKWSEQKSWELTVCKGIHYYYESCMMRNEKQQLGT